MKRIVIERGKGSGWETAVGDKYEDLLKVYDKNGTVIYESTNVSTKPSKKFAGGILKEGEYGGIVGIHRNKTKAILIFKKEFLDKFVKSKAKWQEVQGNLSARTLPSKVFNPTRGDYTMIGINIHDGGELPKGAKPDPKNPYSGTNFSKGCLTIKKSDYQKFIDLFEINEFVEITII